MTELEREFQNDDHKRSKKKEVAIRQILLRFNTLIPVSTLG
jgi:hypothetical protein